LSKPYWTSHCPNSHYAASLLSPQPLRISLLATLRHSPASLSLPRSSNTTIVVSPPLFVLSISLFTTLPVSFIYSSVIRLNRLCFEFVFWLFVWFVLVLICLICLICFSFCFGYFVTFTAVVISKGWTLKIVLFVFVCYCLISAFSNFLYWITILIPLVRLPTEHCILFTAWNKPKGKR
jgi:hypothetical protein